MLGVGFTSSSTDIVISQIPFTVNTNYQIWGTATIIISNTNMPVISFNPIGGTLGTQTLNVNLKYSDILFGQIWLRCSGFYITNQLDNKANIAEIGFWTPTFTSSNRNLKSTINIAEASYFKLDALLHIQCTFNGSVSTVGTGTPEIIGLPFSNIIQYSAVTFAHNIVGTNQWGWYMVYGGIIRGIMIEAYSTVSVDNLQVGAIVGLSLSSVCRIYLDKKVNKQANTSYSDANEIRDVGVFSVPPNTLNIPYASWWSFYITRANNDYNYVQQLAIHSDGDIWIRTIGGANWKPWKQIAFI